MNQKKLYDVKNILAASLLLMVNQLVSRLWIVRLTHVHSITDHKQIILIIISILYWLYRTDYTDIVERNSAGTVIAFGDMNPWNLLSVSGRFAKQLWEPWGVLLGASSSQSKPWAVMAGHQAGRSHPGWPWITTTRHLT